jgi:hypothetical protein
MNSEESTEILQSLLQYYRSKCSQLEYEFLSYKVVSERELSKLREESVSKDKQE